jgi:DNA modification methylase
MAKTDNNPQEAAAVWVDIADLHPWDANPRDNAKAIAEVAKSIRRFGWGAPIVANKRDGEIIAGHTRYAAAQKLKLDRVPVRWLDLDPADAHALALADNKVGEIATWDDATLGQVLRDLRDADESLLADTGFSDEELARLMGEVAPTVLEPEDEPAEVDERGPVHSVLGEVYQLGQHRLMCGDSTSVDAVDVLMAGEKAQMVFTDPPYGMRLDADFSGMKSNPRMFDGKGLLGGRKYDNVIGDHNDFVPELISTVFACFGYCAEIFMWGADYYAELIPSKNDGSWIVWDKRLDESADKMFGSGFELCWSKSKHKRDLARVKWAGVFGTEKEQERSRCHPTQKPVELAKWFFERWGNAGDCVVDLYGGSGSTLLACAQSNRIARLMELDPRYCDVIRRRWTRFAKANNLDAGSGALDG